MKRVENQANEVKDFLSKLVQQSWIELLLVYKVVQSFKGVIERRKNRLSALIATRTVVHKIERQVSKFLEHHDKPTSRLADSRR